jgi:hypothetical protein
LDPFGDRIPCSVAFSNILRIGSIARMKSIGESGSPCLSPHWCHMGDPSKQLRMIRDEVDDQIKQMRSCQHCSNPNLCRIPTYNPT